MPEVDAPKVVHFYVDSTVSVLRLFANFKFRDDFSRQVCRDKNKIKKSLPMAQS